MTDSYRVKQTELKDKQKKLTTTMNSNYTEYQKKDTEFTQQNESQDKRIKEL